MLFPNYLHSHVQIDIFKPQYTHIAQEKSLPPITASFVFQAQLATIVVSTAVEAGQADATSSGVVSNCGDNSYANFIYTHESGCSTTIKNSSGCYGLGQDCNGIVEILCGSDYTCENNYFNNYALKYGGWAGSYAFWLANGWW